MGFTQEAADTGPGAWGRGGGWRRGLGLSPCGPTGTPGADAATAPPPLASPQEQLQLYWAMDSTFELCKICAEGNKDVKIKPCGHLLCRRCLAAWQVGLPLHGEKPLKGLPFAAWIWWGDGPGESRGLLRVAQE